MVGWQDGTATGQGGSRVAGQQGSGVAEQQDRGTAVWQGNRAVGRWGSGVGQGSRTGTNLVMRAVRFESVEVALHVAALQQRPCPNCLLNELAVAGLEGS